MAGYGKKDNKGINWIGILVLLVFMAPQLLLFVPIVLVIYAIIKGTPKKTERRERDGDTVVYEKVEKFPNGTRVVRSSTTTTTTIRRSEPKVTYTQEQEEAKFCFHKDKGYHHVRRGKEQDPWDRPDIDISKYQRKE